MRELNLPTALPPGMTLEQWVGMIARELNQASREDNAKISADAIIVQNQPSPYPDTFDVTAATTSDVAEVLGMLLLLLQNFGNAKEGV